MIGFQIDLGIRTVKTQKEPFLFLPAIPAFPDFRHQIMRQLVGQPAFGLGHDRY